MRDGKEERTAALDIGSRHGEKSNSKRIPLTAYNIWIVSGYTGQRLHGHSILVLYLLADGDDMVFITLYGDRAGGRRQVLSQIQHMEW